MMPGLRLATAISLYLHGVHGQYQLVHDYTPETWLDGFNFFTALDPTGGFVQYVNQSYALEHHLVSIGDSIVLSVDTTNKFPTSGRAGVDTGRPSVRLESKATYTLGLFVLKLGWIPDGCGTWPAFWTYGPSWPAGGEIDIIENVNPHGKDYQNLMSLHTSSNCSVAGVHQTGLLLTSDCTSDGTSSGCGVRSDSTTSFAGGFNSAGGGTFAMEWTSDYIRIWNWLHGQEPADIYGPAPDPISFGTPAANFEGSCDIPSHFANHKIVFDITFCGTWGTGDYNKVGCPSAGHDDGASNCVNYVANNPRAFKDAYWNITSLRVYQKSFGDLSSSSSSFKSLSSATPSSTFDFNPGMGASTTSTNPSGAIALPTQTAVRFPTKASSTDLLTETALRLESPQAGTNSPISFTTIAPSSVIPSTVPTAGAYIYQNCSLDGGSFASSAFGDAPYNPNISSVQDCADWCYTLNTKYGQSAPGYPAGAYVGFGVEAGQACICFNQMTNQGMGSCDEPCINSPRELCGSQDAAGVYVLAPGAIASNGDAQTKTPMRMAPPVSSATRVSSIVSRLPAAPKSPAKATAEPRCGETYTVDVSSRMPARIYCNATLSGVAILADTDTALASGFETCLDRCTEWNKNTNLAQTPCIAVVFSNSTDNGTTDSSGHPRCLLMGASTAAQSAFLLSMASGGGGSSRSGDVAINTEPGSVVIESATLPVVVSDSSTTTDKPMEVLRFHTIVSNRGFSNGARLLRRQVKAPFGTIDCALGSYIAYMMFPSLVVPNDPKCQSRFDNSHEHGDSNNDLGRGSLSTPARAVWTQWVTTTIASCITPLVSSTGA